MGFWAKAFTSVFGASGGPTKTIGQVGQASDQVGWRLLSGQSGNVVRNQKAALNAYVSAGAARAPIDVIAHSIASVNWRVYRAKTKQVQRKATKEFAALSAAGQRTLKSQEEVVKENQLEQVHDHPLVAAMDRGAIQWTAFDAAKLAAVYLETTGNVFYRLDRFELHGGPTISDIVNPLDIKQYPTKKRPFFEVRENDVIVKIAPEQLIWCRDLNPLDPSGPGFGRLQTLMEDVEGDEAAAETQRYKFLNHARPDMLITGKLSTAEADRAELKFNDKHRGPQNAGKIHVTSGENIDIHPLEQSVVDLAIVEHRKFNRENVRGGFTVPPEILGIIDSSNRATIDAASMILSMWSLVPRLDQKEDLLNHKLLPSMGPAAVSRFDKYIVAYDSPVPDDWERGISLLAKAPSAVKVNEARSFGGLEPVDAELGEQFLTDPRILAASHMGAPEEERAPKNGNKKPLRAIP
tara:strand:- start:725 stop:2119 length:1395 start_codon:yes stop_codon:yes gene_type:complete